jgi:hypothetical protein
MTAVAEEDVVVVRKRQQGCFCGLCFSKQVPTTPVEHETRRRFIG